MNIDVNRCIGESFLQSCLGNRSVGYRHPPYTSHPSFVLKTMMNVSRDVHRDLASSRGIGFVDTDMIGPGIHGTAGISNLVQLDLACVCCVLNMQKYAQSMVCASRYLMASSKRRIPATVEVFPKHYEDNQVANANHR